MWVFTVSSLRPSSRSGGGGRTTVGEELQDLALAPGQLAPAAPRGHRRVDEALLLQRSQSGLHHQLSPGSARYVGTGAGLEGDRCQVAVGTLAVGDDSHPRRGPAQCSDRFAAVHAGFVFAKPAAQVDDRYVDAADVADQPDGLLPRLALVDLEVSRQRLAHAKTYQGLGVDHKAMWALARDRSILYPEKSASCDRKGQ